MFDSKIKYFSNLLQLILGGGKRFFLPKNVSNGSRTDKRNLIEEYKCKMYNSKKSFAVLQNASDLRQADLAKYDHVLGLLAMDHMAYDADRDPLEQPTLAEMTQKAIEMLSKNKNGYFLLVEGGRIDHGKFFFFRYLEMRDSYISIVANKKGHHESKASRALDEFVRFDEAIGNYILEYFNRI